MTSTCTALPPPAGTQAVASRRVMLMATGAGLGAAAIYYCQPLVGLLSQDLHASARAAGYVPTLTQLGYAAGILWLTPLGDRLDRRRIIVAKSLLLALALLAGALATSLAALLVASAAVGLAATVAQDIVPAAAALASDAQRGKVVGSVMTGLLLGILLSRVVSGFVAEHWGWRAMYLAAAASVVASGAALWRGLPSFKPAAAMSYRALLGSLAGLWRRHPALRRAAWAQGLLSLGFSAFWSTLAVALHARYQLGSAAAGAFGLAGAAGALAAPLAGRIADRHGPHRVTQFGAALAALSFALMGLEAVGEWGTPAARLALLVVAAVGFDFGIQAALVSHQTLVYSLDPAARSRLNALLFTVMFAGMAAGSALGAGALAWAGWPAVVALSTAAATAAFLVRLGAGGGVSPARSSARG